MAFSSAEKAAVKGQPVLVTFAAKSDVKALADTTEKRKSKAAPVTAKEEASEESDEEESEKATTGPEEIETGETRIC